MSRQDIEVEFVRNKITELVTNVQFVIDKFEQDMKKGDWTKDKEFAVSILSMALTEFKKPPAEDAQQS